MLAHKLMYYFFLSAAVVRFSFFPSLTPFSLFSNARSPVFYAFDQAPCDVTQCAAAIKAHFTDVSSRVLVFLDPSYQHIASTLSAQLSPTFPNFSFGQVDLFVDPAIPMPEPNGKSITILGRTFEIPPENLSQYTLLWIGGEGQTLTHLLMTHAKLPVFSLDPTTMKVRREGETVNKGLMRRLYLVRLYTACLDISMCVATCVYLSLRAFLLMLSVYHCYCYCGRAGSCHFHRRSVKRVRQT